MRKRQAGSDTWQRDDRAIVYQHEGRARYPGVCRTPQGRMLILFTRQTEEQEKEETGDLIVLPRSPDGKWWIRPRVVFSGDGVPRAAGTMTTLADGRIIAPFVLLCSADAESSLRVLESRDDGDTWTVGSPVEQKPLAWAAPNGRPFEIGNEILMPVFGAASADDLAKTKHSCGLLRSEDGGKTWQGWSPIASGSSGDFSFEYPAVLPLGDGNVLAVLTARRLSRGMNAPQVLMRSVSSDGGRTWTEPEQLCVGSWPSLASVGRNTVVCAYSNWCSWPDVRLLVSRDGLETFSQDQMFVELETLHNMDRHPKVSMYLDKELIIEKGRDFWNYNPIPLPPVVPHLGGDWGSGHFGFPSMLAMSDSRILVTLGNMQRGSSQFSPPSELDIPIGHERIEALGFGRIPGGPAPTTKRVRSRGRWELAESWRPEKWSEIVLGGAGGSD
ncbi:MAG: exo-alpha-sialidase, partial [Armatimonadetes bacterium]|nr:exo-alpha-sialidase [Armatimonadota bacterium]